MAMKSNSLQFADDLALLSDSQEGLQKSLDLLSDYCIANDLQLNTDKTKIVIFNKSTRETNPQFWVGEEQLEITKEYRYLGTVFTDNGSFRQAITTLANQKRHYFQS